MGRQYLNIWNVLLIFIMLNLISAFSFAQGQISPGSSGNPNVTDKPMVTKDTGVSEDFKEGTMSSNVSSNKTDETSASEFNIAEVDDIYSAIKYANETRIMQCIDEETKAEIINLYLKYRNAVQNKNKEMIPLLREKALTLRERVMEQVSGCKTNTVPIRQQELNQEMRQVVSTYVERIQNLSSINDTQLRNQIREQIKEETMMQIKQIVAERKEINAADVLPIATAIHLNRSVAKLGDEEINSTNISIKARIRDREMNITRIQERLKIVEKDTEAEIEPTANVVITENETMINDKNLSMTPAEVKERLQERIKNSVMSKLQIKIENNKLIYSADLKENRKILGIIPVAMETRAKINVENAGALEIERPWWAFITTE
ncbi:MAG: hypothetical protein QXK21_01535 [Candidatus Micrarchaeia archaeon]